MTDTVCLVKPHLGMLCLHWRNLLPWTKQITTTQINSLSGCKGQGMRKYSSSCFSVSTTRSLGKFGGLEIQLLWIQVAGMNIALLKTVLFLVLEPA